MKRTIRTAAGLTALCLVMAACSANTRTQEPDSTDSSQTIPAMTTTVSAESEKEDKTVKSTDAATADPFSDDDPYGDNGVNTTVSHSVSLSTEQEDEPAASGNAPAKTEAAPAAEPAETVTLSQKDTSAGKQKDSKKSDKKSSSGVKLVISETGGWNDGTSDFKQYSIKIQNNSKKNVSSWSITIPFGSSASLDQFWCSQSAIKGGTLTASNVDYNGVIEPGKETEFGIIVKSPGKPDLNKAVVSCVFGAAASYSGNNGGGGNGQQQVVPAKEVPPATTDDWLSVSSNRIVDSEGREVWITGINWFGYNTGTNTFDGLWACDLNTSLSEIADHGFNMLRVPISAELIKNWSEGKYPEANFNHATNAYLVDMNSLEIFDYVIGQCRANGLKIMIDIHSAKTDASGHMKNMWYEGDITEADYLAALKWISKRYKNDDTIIAYDLKNEPHGKANENPRAKWDNSYDPDNWRYTAEKAANAVLSGNPNVLIMVEGIEIYPRDVKKGFSSKDPSDYYSTWWGANLRGVKDYPVDLGRYKDKLVYSPHDYGPSVYQQEWFKGNYTYDTLKKDAWYDNWLYIHDQKIAPLLIGEWGGFMTEPNLTWMTYCRKLIKEKRINHTFWCFNSNSGDTGGLVKDDFVTWDEEKYEFVKEVLWQKKGKFVGLDHQIPLGENGTVLK